MNLIGFKHTPIIIYFFKCKLFMLYDNMIYFACCVASHGAQYGLFDQCDWQVIIIVFTRVVIIKYGLHAIFVLL